MTTQYWGIDLGGTKIEGTVLASTDRVEPLCRIRIPTQAENGYEHIISRVVELTRQMIATVGTQPRRMGFGTPGVLDPTSQTLKNSSTTCYIGRSLKQDLEAALGVEAVLANDANCFALAEARLGAGRGAECVFGVILGTGVGGGVVLGGAVRHGCQGIAGEWGHNVVDTDGPQCYCGRRGCVETFLCGPALEQYYAQLSGHRLPLAEIVQRSGNSSDPHAEATMCRMLTYFGRSMAQVVNILDPDAIVLGGGVSNVERLYSEGVAEIARNVFSDRLETRILRNELGDSAGVFGAAMLVA
jgi:fructokinase